MRTSHSCLTRQRFKRYSNELEVPLYNWRSLKITSIVSLILIFLDFLTLQLWRDGKEVEKHESPTKVFTFLHLFFSSRLRPHHSLTHHFHFSSLLSSPHPFPLPLLFPSLIFSSPTPPTSLPLNAPPLISSSPHSPPKKLFFPSYFPSSHLLIFLLSSLSRSFYPQQEFL